MVFHVVRRFEKQEDEVEELAQQIFVKAYEKLSKFDEKSAFSTWLYALATNHCRDYAKNIRRRNVRMSELDSVVSDNLLQQDETPLDNLEQTELIMRMNMALSKLTAEYAEPFLMKYRDGLPYDVMSERLGVSVSALKVRVHRARKELQSQIRYGE